MPINSKYIEPSEQLDFSREKKGSKKLYAIFAFAIFLVVSLAAGTFYFFSTKMGDESRTPNKKELPVIELGKEYEAAYKHKSVNSKLVYVAREKGKEFVVYDGKKAEKGYDSIAEVSDIGGKLAFIAQLSGKAIVVYDGEEVVQDHELIYPLKEIGGKLTFKAERLNKDGKGEMYVYHGGKEEGKDLNFIIDPIEINGKLAFLAIKDNASFIVYDGAKTGKEYASAFQLTRIGHTYAFVAKEGSKQGLKTIIVYDGKEFGKEYDSAAGPFDLSGKLLFQSRKNGKIRLIYDGRKIAQEYDDLRSPTAINGRLSFIAYQGQTSFIDNDGQKLEVLEDQNSSILYLENINNKLAYAVRKLNKYYIVHNGTQIGPYDYMRVSNPQNIQILEVNGKLAFTAKKGAKWVFVYDGKEIAEYDDISNLTLIGNNEIAFAAKAEKEFIVLVTADKL